MDITEHQARRAGHTTHYLASGPADGPLLIFVHGWPELSLSWRHQLPVFGGLGFRAIAPDLRGYGRSSVYDRHEDYAQEHVVADMRELLGALGGERAVWVGHDLGSPTVWNLASLHPEICTAVASLCVPYYGFERGIEQLLSNIDRSIYPQDKFPAGQWDYQLFYQENFERATKVFDADPYRTMKLMLRKGDPGHVGKPATTSRIRAQGGWFGPLDAAPDSPRDADVVSEDDLQVYAEALKRNGFFGPDSYYMNHAANARYAATGKDRLELPVLFVHARYDTICATVNGPLAQPMRERCSDLSETVLDCGHWVAQEKPVALNAALARWLVTRVPSVWPQ